MSKEANIVKAIKLQAQIPTIIAAFARIREGKEPVAPKKGVSIAHNFLYMLPDKSQIKLQLKALG